MPGAGHQVASRQPVAADRLMPIEQLDDFIERTRVAIHVRPEDSLLMIRPDKTLGINASGAAILSALYARPRAGERPSATAILAALAGRLGVSPERLLADARALLDNLQRLLRQDYEPRPGLRFVDYQFGRVRYPTLAEIALTYACQNRCRFCYAASPRRGERGPVMSTGQVRQVMDRIRHEAHVPSLSFTGGEATLRPDLAELVTHGAALGLRVNLITNGRRCADEAYARRLVDAGLASAQLSLEAGTARLHDRIVGRTGAFAQTVAGVRNLQRLGVHVHTNTTLCRDNLAAIPDLLRFVARDLRQKTLSLNMEIRTGQAMADGSAPVSYREVGAAIPPLVALAKAEGLTLVWYSPIPYCIFNPALHGLGAKSCACVHGILSVNPAGELLPCSSFEQGLGSLLERPFEELYQSPAARYWRERRYLPPACAGCPDADLCAGACPLYWDAAPDGFAELPGGGGDRAGRLAWEADRRRGLSFGVGLTGGA